MRRKIDEDRWGRTVGALFLVPTMAAILAGAGALLLAMVFTLFTMDLGAISRAAGVLSLGVLLYGPFLGLSAGLLTGLVTLLVHRSIVVPVASGAFFLVFGGYGLYAIFEAALVASPWGAWIGAAVGALLGIPTGLAMARDDGRGQPRPKQAERGEADVDPWMADFGDGDE